MVKTEYFPFKLLPRFPRLVLHHFSMEEKKTTTQHKKLGRLSKVRYVTNLAQYPASPGDFYIVSYWVQGELRRRAYTGYIPQNNQKLDTVFSTFSLHNFGY